MFPYIEWKTIALGPLTVQVWGLFVSLGILLSVWILRTRAKQKGLSVELVYDGVIWLLIGGFVGARLVHVLFYDPSFYISAPAEIIKIWHGGLSSFGGFMGAGATGWLLTKKRKLPVSQIWLLANEYIFAAVFGWMLGRVGCVMIHDHWGVPCNCPFAIATPSGGRLDMALLEIVGLIPLAIWLFVYRSSQKYSQQFLSIIFVYYGVLRFILDFFRANDAIYLGLTPGQYFAIVLIGLGIWISSRESKR